MNSLFPVSRYGHNPFALSTAFDDIVDSFFNNAPINSKTRRSSVDTLALTPRANVLKTEAGFSIEMAAPGLSRDDFDLSVKNGSLIISVSTEDSKEYTSSLTMQEYSYNSFSRSWALPTEANISGIAARYEAGILIVDVPVQDRAADSITIDVK